jgi:tRNA U34 2-thiouridine synthase MnmA/TrmU
LVLFSGGLDSILACKVLQKAGIKVTALKFVTPFFGSSALGDEERAGRAIGGRYGIDCRVIDISGDYLRMVVDPPHGYGKHMNPCIDCKILMVKTALGLLDEYGASFVATGEVPGQRPMSQRTDTLRIIERESGAEGLLLRPLAASLFRPVRAEEAGLFSGRDLPLITGRGRKEQMKLAEKFGIEDYPSPAGGCVLADPILGKRFEKLFSMRPAPTVNDILLARTGRHFLLPGGAWFVVGRNRRENERLKKLAVAGDMIMRFTGVPGPFSILRHISGTAVAGQACEQGAELLARYVTKRGEGRIAVNVSQVDANGEISFIRQIERPEQASRDIIKRLMF